MIEAFVEQGGSITVHMSREDAQALLRGDDARENGLLDELSAALDIQRSARESMYERPTGATVATWSDPRCQVTTMSATFAERCKLVDGHAGGHLFGAES